MIGKYYIPVGFLLASFTLSAHSSVQSENYAEVSLISAASSYEDRFTLGLHFVMQPGWYIYWINPGDAGITVEADWQLPAGFTASDLRYPVPEKFESGGIVSYGYKNEIVLLTEFNPPAGFHPGNGDKLTAAISWMVCRESCYLESGTVDVPFREIPVRKELIEASIRSLPDKLDDNRIRIVAATVRQESDRRIIELRLEGTDAGSVTEYYPYQLHDFVVNHDEIEINGNVIRFPATPYTPETTIDKIGGLLLLNGEGYEFETRLEMRP